MGTDIHTALEVKKHGAWVSLTKIEPYEEDDPWLCPVDSIADGRDYGFFAALAGVRNGSGFAGVDTGDAIKPIDEPRGIPDDLSPEVQKWYDQGIEHTPSWVTLRDVLNYDWTVPRTQRGWVSPGEWAWYVYYGHPNSWSGGIGGGAVIQVTEKDFQDQWQATTEHLGIKNDRYTVLRLKHKTDEAKEAQRVFFSKWPNCVPYAQVSWTRPLYETLSDNLTELLAEMLAAKIKHGVTPQDVRLVFYFDS